MANAFNWDAPPLSAEDQRLIEAYKQAGRPIDDLAYTDQFEGLVHILGVADTQFDRHVVYKRLLTLRQMGRLPSLLGVR